MGDAEPAQEGARDAAFDAYVDEPGPLEIQGFEILASDALWTDPVAYRTALEQWRRDQEEQFEQEVVESFPYPVAHPYGLFLNGSEHPNQQFQFLKDTWEALVSLTMGLILGEMRSHAIISRGSGVDKRWLRSQTIAHRIEVTKRCKKCLGEAFFSCRLVSEEAIQKMLHLNERRNQDFAHVGTLNDKQSRTLILDTKPGLDEILRQLGGLRALRLVRPKTMTRFETFVGDNPRRRFESVKLSSAARAALAQREDFENEIFAYNEREGFLFCLSPYFLCRPTERGHRTELAYFKKKSGEGADSVFHYEVIGDAAPFQLSDERIRKDFAEIKDMFVADERGEGND